MKRFETGKTYKTVNMGNFTVISRTAKTITVLDINDKPITRRIYIYEGSECVKPLGNYSMAPVLRADREVIIEDGPFLDGKEFQAIAKELAKNVISIDHKGIRFNKVGTEMIKGFPQELIDILKVPVVLYFQKEKLFAGMLK